MAFFTRGPLLCVALFFAIAPALLCALDENEIQMTLYIHQAWGTSAINEANLLKGSDNTRFGESYVHDWPIREMPDTNARVIGHARGFHMNTKPVDDEHSWYTAMIFVFTDERFKGSTLQVIGFHPRPGEWSIVGGTGIFSMARGVVKYTYQQENSCCRTYKANVHAYYSSLFSTAVSGKSGWNSNISEPISVN